jgi:hypothetical protein
MHHPTIPEIQANVANRIVEEDEVAGLSFRSGDLSGLGKLSLRLAGQADSGK